MEQGSGGRYLGRLLSVRRVLWSLVVGVVAGTVTALIGAPELTPLVIWTYTVASNLGRRVAAEAGTVLYTDLTHAAKGLRALAEMLATHEGVVAVLRQVRRALHTSSNWVTTLTPAA